jgi:cell division transport system permease protein
MAQKEEIIVGRRLKTSYITTVVSISLVLFVLGLLGLVILHAQMISDHVRQNIGITVILRENISEADAQSLSKRFSALQEVNSSEYVSRDKAAALLMADLGEDFVAFLGYNPLNPAIELRVKSLWANNDSLAVLEKKISSMPGVLNVEYQKDLVHLVNENVKKIGFVLVVFSMLLMVIAFALINNTIRLSVFSKRFLIKSMQLVGATQGFIRRPFLWKSITQGIIGALIAIGLLIGSLYAAQKQIPELAEFQKTSLLAGLFFIVILLGVIITWISTYFAVKKYLRIKTDNLYFY